MNEVLPPPSPLQYSSKKAPERFQSFKPSEDSSVEYEERPSNDLSITLERMAATTGVTDPSNPFRILPAPVQDTSVLSEDSISLNESAFYINNSVNYALMDDFPVNGSDNEFPSLLQAEKALKDMKDQIHEMEKRHVC